MTYIELMTDFNSFDPTTWEAFNRNGKLGIKHPIFQYELTKVADPIDTVASVAKQYSSC